MGEFFAAIWYVNAVLMTSTLLAGVTTGIGGGLMVRVNLTAVEVPPALLAATIKVNVPVEVGVPLIIPVVALSVSPEGSFPLMMLYAVGEFVAVIW